METTKFTAQTDGKTSKQIKDIIYSLGDRRAEMTKNLASKLNLFCSDNEIFITFQECVPQIVSLIKTYRWRFKFGSYRTGEFVYDVNTKNFALEMFFNGYSAKYDFGVLNGSDDRMAASMFLKLSGETGKQIAEMMKETMEDITAIDKEQQRLWEVCRIRYNEERKNEIDNQKRDTAVKAIREVSHKPKSLLRVKVTRKCDDKKLKPFEFIYDGNIVNITYLSSKNKTIYSFNEIPEEKIQKTKILYVKAEDVVSSTGTPVCEFTNDEINAIAG